MGSYGVRNKRQDLLTPCFFFQNKILISKCYGKQIESTVYLQEKKIIKVPIRLLSWLQLRKRAQKTENEGKKEEAEPFLTGANY